MIKPEFVPPTPLKDNQKYYDEFSYSYEKDRNKGYHKLIDNLEVDFAERYCRDKMILEAGCGTGLILNRLRKQSRFSMGVDISSKMLRLSKRRNLRVALSDLLNLPFRNETFDVVYSFKVLPHIPDIRQVLTELSRVTKKNGYLLVEFYNRYSLRYLVRRLTKAKAISEQSSDRDVFTRYDSYGKMKSYLPAGHSIVASRGIRIFSPSALVFKIPVIADLFRIIEYLFCGSFLKFFGGFFILVLRKD